MRTTFAFIYPVTDKKVDLDRPGGYRYDHITDLVISGSGRVAAGSNPGDPPEDRYDFDIEKVDYEGRNILPLMEAWDIMDEVEEAALHHLHQLMTRQESDYQNYYRFSDPLKAKVITLPLRRKIR